jgi:glycosyltransferase involved in cell wall biosynthesis
MKILLYSSVFWPSLGGVETITATLAENIVRLGQECIVVTETPSDQEDNRSYRVVRRPKLRERFELTRQCDLVHSNGASLAMFPFAKLNHKPFIWTHNGYQVSCVDGLGWVDGEPAPMTPIPSLIYHFQKKGLIHFLKESIKLAIRRYVAVLVNLNVAATEWVAKRQPLKNQIVSYTPYPLNLFKSSKSEISKKYDFIYVGRLVSEKGVPDLIKAFHILLSSPNGREKKLAIVGEGNIRSDLEKLVSELQLTEHVFFLGSQYGKDLIEIIAQSKIAVVPSVWEEPMGGVALELLAAGKNIIVSEFGGHAECVGNAGLKFKNGDYQSLYECMIKLLTDESLAKHQLKNASIQVKLFDEVNLTKKYISIYQSLLNHNQIQAII